jgi:hypothetical protein
LTSQCHTTFDWNTGEIETGVIHNPHYYEYQRKNGTLQRNPGDRDCNQRIPTLFPLIELDNQNAIDLHRLIMDITCARRRDQPRDPNRKNRVDYMLGAITEEQFKVRWGLRPQDEFKLGNKVR